MTQEDPSSQLTSHTVTGTTSGLHSVSGPCQMALQKHHTWSLRCQRQAGPPGGIQRAELMGTETVSGALRGDFEGAAAEGTSPRPVSSPGPGS